MEKLFAEFLFSLVIAIGLLTAWTYGLEGFVFGILGYIAARSLLHD